MPCIKCDDECGLRCVTVEVPGNTQVETWQWMYSSVLVCVDHEGNSAVDIFTSKGKQKLERDKEYGQVET